MVGLQRDPIGPCCKPLSREQKWFWQTGKHARISRVSDLSTSEWPHWDALTPTFKSSFSSINEEAYEAAREIWPNAVHFAQHQGLDASDALEPFLKVVASVSRIIEQHEPQEIKSLPSYLFRSYQRAIWRRLKEEKKHESLDSVNND